LGKLTIQAEATADAHRTMAENTNSAAKQLIGEGDFGAINQKGGHSSGI
jgi:hypothetical protein